MGITEGILAEVRQQAEAVGERKGKKEGLQKGLQEGDRARSTTAIKNMLKKGYAKQEILEILEVEEQLVEEIIKTIAGDKAEVQ